MRKLYKYLATAVLLAVTLLSCQKEEKMPVGTFRITEEVGTINFTQESQYQFIPVESNIPASEWRFSSSEPWCVAGPSITGEKGIMISVYANEEPDQRPAEVSVTARAASYTFKVVQLGYGPAILVSDVFVAAGGGEAVVKVTSNIPYTLSEPRLDDEDIEDGEDPWLTKSATTKALADTEFRYIVQPNYTAGRRVAVIKVQAEDRSLSSVDKECVITQNIVEDTASEDVIGGSEPVYPVSVVAVSGDNARYYSWDAEVNWEGAGGPELMIDGSEETYYCSPRGLDKEGDRGTEFPFEFVFTFEDVLSIDYMRITPWDGSGNQIKSCNLYWMPEDSDEFVMMNNPEVPYTIPLSSEGYSIMFDETLVRPKAVKVEVLEAYWNLVKIKEVEFYKTNRQDTHDWILRVFTDLSCSELKPGVTKKEINEMAAVAPYIAKNVAMPLYQGTYSDSEKEFRIHAYEPYSNPATFKKAFNIRLYSELDNPTGILVQNGGTMIVCVDKIPAGHSVRIEAHGDQSNGYEFNYGGAAFSQMLKAGVNVVPVSMSSVTEALLFVVHTAENLTPASESVKVHFLPGSGTVVGYYNSAIHDDARYKEILSRYTYKYFMLKGEKMLIAAHAQQLRSAAPNSYSSGLAQLDKIVGWEKDLMGLTDRTEFNNHILSVTTTASGVHMDASDRRIRYQASALKNYATAEDVCASPWGLGHEIGHVNQPAICWESTIESSNNLFSNYVMLMCGIQESRGRTLSLLAESCGLPWYQLGDTGQYQNEDAELHMRMNWQLWNYFHRCGIDTQFWPKVFENARQNPAPGMYYWQYGYKSEDPGLAQLMFYEHCCDAAGMDLTEFFETWGFFRLVDDTYGQYNSGMAYQVTQAMVDEFKSRIAGKGYPKAPAIQYLEDRKRPGDSSYNNVSPSDPGYRKDVRMGYYTTFQNKVTMTKVPTYTLSGRTVTVSDYDQAVAVEIRDNKGELLYFSNLDRFDIPNKTGAGKAIDLDYIKFQAVQWDGVRKDMTRK